MNVEEVVESTATEPVEEVVESATTEEFGLSDDDIIGIETSGEPEEETLLTEGEEAPISNTQKRFNELTAANKIIEAKRVQAENMNNYLLSQMQKIEVAQTPVVPEPTAPKYDEFLEKFDNDEEKARNAFIEAKVEFAVHNKMAQAQADSQKQAALNDAMKAETEYVNKAFTPEILNKYPDWHQVVSTQVQFKDPIKRLIHKSAVAHDISYSLAKNTDLRNYINSVSVAEGAKVIGMIEQQMATPMNKKLKSKAATAIAPLGSKAKAVKVKEEDQSYEAIIEQENKKRVAANGF
jgi:hypothetical protein